MGDDLDGFFAGEQQRYVSKFLVFQTQLVKAAGSKGARIAAAMLGKRPKVFDVNKPSVQNFIADDLAKRSRLITESTARIVKGELLDAVNNQQGIFEMRDRLTAKFADMTEHRAEAIARTEVGRASSHAELEGYREMGVERKEWIAELDDRTRDAHAEADGQTVGINEMFDVGGELLEAPGMGSDPGNSINCRCAVAPVASED